MIKRIVGCGGWRLRVREGCVWGEYCVGLGKGEKRGGVRLVRGRVVAFGWERRESSKEEGIIRWIGVSVCRCVCV
jgi:hypothetical protein